MRAISRQARTDDSLLHRYTPGPQVGVVRKIKFEKEKKEYV